MLSGFVQSDVILSLLQACATCARPCVVKFSARAMCFCFPRTCAKVARPCAIMVPCAALPRFNVDQFKKEAFLQTVETYAGLCNVFMCESYLFGKKQCRMVQSFIFPSLHYMFLFAVFVGKEQSRILQSLSVFHHSTPFLSLAIFFGKNQCRTLQSLRCSIAPLHFAL